MNSRCVENEKSMMDTQMMGGMSCPTAQACPTAPVFECPQERVCERVIVHEVPHVMPINTKIVNRHIYRHTFTPCYTCEECDTCENVYDSCPKNF